MQRAFCEQKTKTQSFNCWRNSFYFYNRVLVATWYRFTRVSHSCQLTSNHRVHNHPSRWRHSPTTDTPPDNWFRITWPVGDSWSARLPIPVHTQCHFHPFSCLWGKCSEIEIAREREKNTKIMVTWWSIHCHNNNNHNHPSRWSHSPTMLCCRYAAS